MSRSRGEAVMHTGLPGKCGNLTAPSSFQNKKTKGRRKKYKL
jgi:hypothetical protein